MGRKSVLPREVIEVAHRYGLGGRRVYIPKQSNSPGKGRENLLDRFVPELLREIEADYESRGVTFYLEASSDRVFSGTFGKGKIAGRFQLKLRTASRVLAEARNAWRQWFSRTERLKLDQLRAIARESGFDYSALYFSYLEIRGILRSGKQVDGGYCGGDHILTEEASFEFRVGTRV